MGVASTKIKSDLSPTIIPSFPLILSLSKDGIPTGSEANRLAIIGCRGLCAEVPLKTYLTPLGTVLRQAQDERILNFTITLFLDPALTVPRVLCIITSASREHALLRNFPFRRIAMIQDRAGTITATRQGIQRIEIDPERSESPTFEGRSFGSVGQYEKAAGHRLRGTGPGRPASTPSSPTLSWPR